MKRRDFLKVLSVIGGSAALPVLPTRQGMAATDAYNGPYFLFFQANGGWDPTLLCDPKITIGGVTQFNQIQTAGNISYASPPYGLTDTFAKTFFDTYAPKLLVVNGVDTLTNGHHDGRRHVWSGEIKKSNFPSVGALASGLLTPTRPMAWLTSGGSAYEKTAGVVAATRVSSLTGGTLYDIAYPNRSSNVTSASAPEYFNTTVLNSINSAKAQRAALLAQEQNLIQAKQMLEKFTGSRIGLENLKVLANDLATSTQISVSDSQARTAYQKGRAALASFQAGLSTAASIVISGYDTHGDNQQTIQYPRQLSMLKAVDAVMKDATARGIADKIVVVIGSDFGRTNKYNASNGKDHWPITSMMLMGPGIRGNRLLGGTDADHKALEINPNTLQTVTSGGVRLEPGHIHHALRKLAGVDTDAKVIADFALSVSPLGKDPLV